MKKVSRGKITLKMFGGFVFVSVVMFLFTWGITTVVAIDPFIAGRNLGIVIFAWGIFSSIVWFLYMLHFKDIKNEIEGENGT